MSTALIVFVCLHLIVYQHLLHEDRRGKGDVCNWLEAPKNPHQIDQKDYK